MSWKQFCIVSRYEGARPETSQMNMKGTVQATSEREVLVCRTVTDRNFHSCWKTFQIWVTNKMEHQRLKSSGMLCNINLKSVTSVSNDCSTYTFRVNQSKNTQLLDPEDESTMVTIHQLTLILHQNCCENLNSRNIEHTAIKN